MSILVDYKKEIKKPSFYIAIISCILALIGLIFYMTKGKTQYNGLKLTPIIIVMLIIGMVCVAASLILNIRFLRYGAAVAFLYAFLELVITEINFWSNWIIATDPVDGNILTQYFVETILVLVATIGAFVSAVMVKKAYYKAEGAPNAAPAGEEVAQ